MKKCLLVAMLLCVTVAGFAKREKIPLEDRVRSLMPPVGLKEGKYILLINSGNSLLSGYFVVE